MFIGLLIGLILSKFVKDRWLIPVCMFWSIVPDIVDKPLALKFLELNSGRTVAHTILVMCICMLVLSLFWYNRHKILILAVGLSLFFHQLGDSLWHLPTTWFFPLFGMFIIDHGIGVPGDWFWTTFWIEVTSPVEWVSGVGMVLILILYVINERRKNESKNYAHLKENVDGGIPGQ